MVAANLTPRPVARNISWPIDAMPPRVGSDLEDAWEEAMSWEGSGILEVRTHRDRNRIDREGVIEAIALAVGGGR